MASTGEAFGLFWNSDEGDRTYDANSFEYWLKKFFTAGVFNGDLQVRALGGMTLQVDAGYANVDGKVRFWNESFNITLEAANSTMPRIDTIVITRDNINRQITCEKITGTYSADAPQPTAPVRNNEIYQLVLAQIYVAAGVTSIIQANITDTRSNSDLCGWITGTVEEMDFSQFAAQFASYYEDFTETNQADFETWFDHMKDQLDTDAAGHLQGEIDTINNNIESIEGDIDLIEADIDTLEGDIPKKLYQYSYDNSQWDTAPTANSTKPVTSGGLKAQFDAVTNEFSDITNILGAKNILPNGASTVTTNGITFTVNANGTVKATGTATADATLVLSSSFYVGNGRKVILSGCPSGGSTSKYFMYLTNENGNTSKGNDVGNGVTVTADANNLGCRILVKSGQALGTSGITFSPMVRPANIRNASYVPYAMTNRELSSQISSCPNFINPTSMTVVFDANGTYTIQKDGIYEIILNGSTQNDSHVYLNGFTILYTTAAGNVYRTDTVTFPLKAGAKLTMDAYGRMTVRLFE